MPLINTASPARRFPQMLSWSRLMPPYIVCVVLSLIWLPGWNASYAVLIGRLLIVATILVLVFGSFERWPPRLPNWLARWVLQVAGVAIAVPFATALVYTLTTIGDPVYWPHNKERMAGYFGMCMFGLLIAPWMAMSALHRQISGEAQRQALAFDLERSEFERRETEARLSLMQAQVEPHFLFNTLANVRELVDSGSAQASAVLGHLIAYLRAAVPRLHGATSTMAQEVELVRAYLEVMHMRMPDRLAFAIDAGDEGLAVACPPMTLLILVENAVRHGIDPSEQGGRIEVRVRVGDGRCRVEVVDTGVGLTHANDGMGTGLSNLRERMQLAFGGDARLTIAAREPHGVSAELDFPARRENK
ncbi:MAG: histidine kinase [Rudaea sp.]